MRSTSPTKKTSPWAAIIIVLLVLYFFVNPLDLLEKNRGGEPRPITARGDLADDEQNTIDIFKNVSPSVVYITSIAVKRDLFSLNAVEIPQGTGSGFVWDDQGRIVTNYHVISDANRIKVTMADQTTWKATLVGVAPDRDLAVLQIGKPLHTLKPIPLGESTDLQVGQKVFAIGNPFGLDHSITSGIISALGREINAITGRVIKGVIQTDAAINPGNSGGPLLDSAGRLIGVNTAIYSPSGAYAGIGFAVPVQEVNKVVPQIIRYGRMIKPGIGASLADSRMLRRLGIEKGVMVLGVQGDGPAEKAGLRPTTQYRGEIVLGDVITQINGRKVQSYNDIRDEIEKFKVGEEIIVTVVRNGVQKDIPLTLGAIE